MFYRCHNCRLNLLDLHVVDGLCPECHEPVEAACSLDTMDCNHEVVSGIKVCPECGEFVCPECGNHNVEVISRITGYLSPVSNWNTSKKNELINRNRYSVGV